MYNRSRKKMKKYVLKKIKNNKVPLPFEATQLRILPRVKSLYEAKHDRFLKGSYEFPHAHSIY